MKFMLKFVSTPELKEFYGEINSLLDNLKDAESLVEGVSLLFCIATLYFVFSIITF